MNLILGKVLVIFIYLFVFISSFIPLFLYRYSFITFYFPFSYFHFCEVQLSRDSNYFFPIFNTSLLISLFTILSLMRSSIYFFFLPSINFRAFQFRENQVIIDHSSIFLALFLYPLIPSSSLHFFNLLSFLHILIS